MIVYLIGGHGSGKSTAVRSLMRARGGMTPVVCPGRRRPLGYNDGTVFVLGHYDIPNGGSDTVRPMSRMMETMREWSRVSSLVVAEGVGQAGFPRELLRLSRLRRVEVILLSTDLETCAASVAARGHKLSREGVERAWRRSRRAAELLRDGGVDVLELSRRATAKRLREVADAAYNSD